MARYARKNYFAEAGVRLSEGTGALATPRARGEEKKYRSDIDGLRAVAVLLVVIFHLGGIHNHPVIFMPGGFTGVDVFFVISGYLLTGIIDYEIGKSKFSIASFYERRARRILPALIALLLTTTLVSLIFLLPGELIAYAHSLIAATFSYSNFYFWSVSSYFDSPGSKPLLHTWSLAVEEQFYIVLPILLIVLARVNPRIRVGILLALAGLSFAFSVWAAHGQRTAAFYSPFSRAWELLLGSLLAVGIVPALRNRIVRELCATAGAALIFFGAVRLSGRSDFPGVAALMPCGGAFLILAAGRDGETIVGNVLSLRPITFIGLISFSVYLWHWPLIVFSTMGLLPIPTHDLYFPVMIVLSLLAGAISWKYVEKPFRTGAFRRMPRTRVFGISAFSMTLCASIALLLIGNQGLAWRYPPAAINIAALTGIPQQMQAGTCFIDTGYGFSDYKKDLCLHLDAKKKNYLLLGDSHSAALWYGLSKGMRGANILQASAAGCSMRVGLHGQDNCSKLASYVFDDFLKTHRLDGLIFTERWRHASDFTEFAETVAWCKRQNIPVYILGPVMEYNAPLPRLLAYAITYHNEKLVRESADSGLIAMDRSLKRIAVDEWHVPYFSLLDVECPAGDCLIYADAAHTTPMLFDDNHLSNGASLYLIDRLIADKTLASRRIPN
jgi:peptidoglycan/LPS O-acetylase OafA/YrhL